MSPSIRIRVGAAVDANISNAFKPLVRAARDARMAVEEEMEKAWAAINGVGMQKGGGAGGPYRSVIREAAKAADRIVSEEKKKQRKLEQEEKREQRRKEGLEKYKARVRDRYFREQQKQGERDDADKVGKREERIRAIAGGTKENLKRIGAGALGVAGSVARGAGVQTDLASYVGQAVQLETMATDLSASAYNEQRDKGTRIDPKRLVAQAREVGQFAAFDPTQVIEGMQSYVGSTGDLATVQAALPNIAKLARATGTDLSVMIAAAGKVGNALGDWGDGQPFQTAADKGKALVGVLRQLAGQGKVGSVEMKDLAVYGGKLAAASMAFTNNPTQNLAEMGALAQISMQGGASSAAEAATAVAGFVNTLKTPAREKEFLSKGVKTRDEETGRFFSIAEILQDAAMGAVERGGGVAGATTEWKKMFANVQGAKAADPAFNAFLSAYSAELKTSKDTSKAQMAGIKAINDLLGKFGGKATISEQEEATSFAGSMKTSAAQVQLFNNSLSKVGENVSQRVLPELVKLAPYALKAANAFAGLVEYGAENPGKAAAAALGASIAKASVDTVAKQGVEKLMTSIASSAAASKGLAIVAGTIAIGTLGMMTIDAIADTKQKGVEGSIAADAAAQNAVSALKGASRTGSQAQAEQALVAGREQQAMLEQRLAAAEKPTGFFEALFGPKSFNQRAQEQEDAAKKDDLKATLETLKAEMAKVAGALKGPLNVQGTVNVGNNAGPTANTAATTK